MLDKEERKASIVEQVNQAAALIGGRSHHRRRLAERSHQPDRNAHRGHGRIQRRIPVLAARCVDLGDEEAPAIFPGREERANCWRISSPSATATTSTSTSSAKGTNTCSARALRMRTSSSAKMSNSSSKTYRPKLSTLTFHTKLGSMLDKSDRMLKLGAELAAMLGFKDVKQIKHLARAVYLAKADLVTQMVTEMTSLQGIIGGEYALRSGEPRGGAGDRRTISTRPEVEDRAGGCAGRPARFACRSLRRGTGSHGREGSRSVCAAPRSALSSR